ncbi:MAG: Tryptophan synthase alpha chain [Polyangiaceae bacterium]|nr:Tryptophan synthase alpha chain [Polyangiaceae bacterium]
MAARWLAALLYCWVALGCSGGGDGKGPRGGTRQLGERCETTEECASLLCVRLDESGGICSKSCQDAQACPASDNWDCLGAPGQSFSVCACLPLGETEVCGDGLDNECNGVVDDCQSCAGSPVPRDDPANCGACGNACRADQACDGKECVCPDTAPEECGGACTSVTTDALNCGECGTVCALGQTCSQGKCECDDFVKRDFCPGTGCLDFESDANNCGSCGNVCTLGQSCVSGKCACPAGGPQDFCSELGCVDLASAATSCGTCGNACSVGQSCVAGKCACPNGQSACDGSCVDLSTDEQNCGACGQICPQGQACAGGACGCSASALTSCGGDCADLANDVDNCGTCGNVCADGEQCSGGCQCQSAVYCGTSCMPAGDPQNCGACGNACSASQYCNGGRCECQGFGLTKCGAACYDVYNDAQHCGSCARACRSGEQCVSGDCQCPFGETYCAAAGKCVSLSSDPANCGSCGNVCNPSEACSSGVCACPQNGQKFCAAEGKCVDTLSSTANCGSCGTKCQATEVCSLGSCDCTGSTQTYCAAANACVDVWTSNQHCGACNVACPAGTQCSFGTCYCANGNESLCGSSCVDLQTSTASCGSCGNSCESGEVCTSGRCRCPNPTVGAAVRLTENELTDTAMVAAWDGTHVGVAYFRQVATTSSYYNLRFALLNPDGTLFKDVAVTSYADGELRAAATSFSSETSWVNNKPSLVWNGREYAVIWNDLDATQAIRNNVKLVRISAAGEPSAPVTVVSGQELGSVSGPSVAWSEPYGGYIVSGHSEQSVFYRRVGAQGTALQPRNSYPSTTGCRATSTAVSPLGFAAVSCNTFSGVVGFFNADGSRTREPVTLGLAFIVGDTETLWDGTTFDTAMMWSDGNINLYRDGRSASVPWVQLLPHDSSAKRSSFATTWLGGALALGIVDDKTFQLRRYRLSTDVNAEATSLHDPVTVVSTPNVINTAELVAAGSSKLLAIWQDDRWSTRGDLFAAPIDLKACP